MILRALFLFLTLSAFSLRADAVVRRSADTEDEAQEELTDATFISPIKLWTDPFWVGSTVGLTFTSRSNSFRDLQTLQLNVNHGFESGLVVQTVLPFIIRDSNPSPSGELAPRIGGGPIGRVEVDGLFRFWGDAFDFLAVTVGVGLPYQSDAIAQNTTLGSWIVPMSLLMRKDMKWVAVQPSVSLLNTFPFVKTNANGTTDYVDSSNTITAAVQVLFYPSKVLALTVGWSVSPTNHSTVGSDQENNALVLSQNTNNGTQNATFGINWTPLKTPMVFSLSATDELIQSNQQATKYGGGTIKWLF